MSPSPLKAAHAWLFDTHPKAGVAVMYGTLNAIGDTLAQTFFSSSAYDPARTQRFWLFGVGIASLALMWNAYLERNDPLRPTSSVPRPEEPVPLESIQIHTASHSRSSSLQTNGLGLDFPASDEKRATSTEIECGRAGDRGDGAESVAERAGGGGCAGSSSA